MRSPFGAQANVTGPSAYQGQSAGYYSGGAMWARFPQKKKLAWQVDATAIQMRFGDGQRPYTAR